MSYYTLFLAHFKISKLFIFFKYLDIFDAQNNKNNEEKNHNFQYAFYISFYFIVKKLHINAFLKSNSVFPLLKLCVFFTPIDPSHYSVHKSIKINK